MVRREDIAIVGELQVVGAVVVRRSNGPIIAAGATEVQYAVIVVQVTRRRIPGGLRRTDT